MDGSSDLMRKSKIFSKFCLPQDSKVFVVVVLFSFNSYCKCLNMYGCVMQIQVNMFAIMSKFTHCATGLLFLCYSKTYFAPLLHDGFFRLLHIVFARFRQI